MKERIKVNTEKLKEKSAEWTEVAETAGKELEKAGEVMENLQAGFWAEPIASIQKAFEQMVEKCCRQTEELCNHMKKLSFIAESYEEAENENELAIRDN